MVFLMPMVPNSDGGCHRHRGLHRVPLFMQLLASFSLEQTTQYYLASATLQLSMRSILSTAVERLPIGTSPMLNLLAPNRAAPPHSNLNQGLAFHSQHHVPTYPLPALLHGIR